MAAVLPRSRSRNSGGGNDDGENKKTDCTFAFKLSYSFMLRFLCAGVVAPARDDWAQGPTDDA